MEHYSVRHKHFPFSAIGVATGCEVFCEAQQQMLDAAHVIACGVSAGGAVPHFRTDHELVAAAEGGLRQKSRRLGEARERLIAEAIERRYLVRPRGIRAVDAHHAARRRLGSKEIARCYYEYVGNPGVMTVP